MMRWGYSLFCHGGRQDEGVEVMRCVLLVVPHRSYTSCCLALRLGPRRHSLPNIVQQSGIVWFEASGLFVMLVWFVASWYTDGMTLFK